MPLTVTDYENIVRKLVGMKPELKPIILDLMLNIPTPEVNNNPTEKPLHTLEGKYNAVAGWDTKRFMDSLDNRILHGCVFPPIAVTFLLQGKKINAIKEVKVHNKCDLKTAKDAVELASSYLYNVTPTY